MVNNLDYEIAKTYKELSKYQDKLRKLKSKKAQEENAQHVGKFYKTLIDDGFGHDWRYIFYYKVSDGGWLKGLTIIVRDGEVTFGSCIDTSSKGEIEISREDFIKAKVEAYASMEKIFGDVG